MSFNEWRHRHTNYDNRMRTALTVEQKMSIRKEIAMAAMRQAVEQNDKQFASSVMSWAQAYKLI